MSNAATYAVIVTDSGEYLYRSSLGTRISVGPGRSLLRTCDAVGACPVVPRLPWVPEALARGNTPRRRRCVHWVRGDPTGWLAVQRKGAAGLSGVELVEEAIRLADLTAARARTVVVLGHEQGGIPPQALELLDTAVEIPMVGIGTKPERRSRRIARALPPGRAHMIERIDRQQVSQAAMAAD